MKKFHKLVVESKNKKLPKKWRFIYVKQELWKELNDFTNL